MRKIRFGALLTPEMTGIAPGRYTVDVLEVVEPEDGTWGNVSMEIDLHSMVRLSPKPETNAERLDRLESEIGQVRCGLEQHVDYTHDGEEPPYHEVAPRVPVRCRFVGKTPEKGEVPVRVVNVRTGPDGAVLVDFEVVD